MVLVIKNDWKSHPTRTRNSSYTRLTALRNVHYTTTDSLCCGRRLNRGILVITKLKNETNFAPLHMVPCSLKSTFAVFRGDRIFWASVAVSRLAKVASLGQFPKRRMQRKVVAPALPSHVLPLSQRSFRLNLSLLTFESRFAGLAAIGRERFTHQNMPVLLPLSNFTFELFCTKLEDEESSYIRVQVEDFIKAFNEMCQAETPIRQNDSPVASPESSQISYSGLDNPRAGSEETLHVRQMRRGREFKRILESFCVVIVKDSFWQLMDSTGKLEATEDSTEFLAYADLILSHLEAYVAPRIHRKYVATFAHSPLLFNLCF